MTPVRAARRMSAAAAVLALAALPVHAQTAAGAPRLAADLREEVLALPVTVSDAYGRTESLSVPLTVYRPAGNGPFPLAVVGHGRSPEQRAQFTRARFEWLSRYLVGKGFAVLVPTRAGYGESASLFDPEDSGPCQNRRFEPLAAATSGQLLAAVAFAARQPWADASRWIVVGQSVGGLTAMAVAARAPQGLKAAINFSGGSGGATGDNAARAGNPCSPQALQRLWREQAATTPLPVLWIYWTHDRAWGETWPRDWAQAWRDGGGRIEFHHLPPWSAEPVDGHLGYERDMDHALPLLEAHLARAGFTTPGLPQRPPASGHARLDEVDKLPLQTAAARQQALERFGAARRPRALAIGAGGRYAWAQGDWAIGRALGFCASSEGRPCKLYAVDDDVVWVP